MKTKQRLTVITLALIIALLSTAYPTSWTWLPYAMLAVQQSIILAIVLLQR